MIIRLNELKARKATRGERVTLNEIAEATGINRRTLDNIAAGKQTELRGDYIDALATYFGVTPNELIEISQVELPLTLNIRPDRRGARVGTTTKQSVTPPAPGSVTAAARQRQRDALAPSSASITDDERARFEALKAQKLAAAQAERARLSQVARLEEEE